MTYKGRVEYCRHLAYEVNRLNANLRNKSRAMEKLQGRISELEEKAITTSV